MKWPLIQLVRYSSWLLRAVSIRSRHARRVKSIWPPFRDRSTSAPVRA